MVLGIPGEQETNTVFVFSSCFVLRGHSVIPYLSHQQVKTQAKRIAFLGQLAQDLEADLDALVAIAPDLDSTVGWHTVIFLRWHFFLFLVAAFAVLECSVVSARRR